MKKVLMLLLILVLAVSMVACSESPATSEGETEGEATEDTKVDLSRVRVVIGSTSTGGDTYENADFITRYLEDELDTNMKVDPVGAARAFVELEKADEDGSTIMFFHDMAYLGIEYGSFSEDYALENWEVGPMVSINPGNVLLTKHDAPYNNLAEAAEWLTENADETITVAIEAGGVSEITFDAFYLWVKDEYGTEVSDRMKVYITGSQSDKDQALWDGNADIIHGSVGSNAQFTEEGVSDDIKMKFLGLTATERMEGYDIPTFGEQGITFDGKAFAFDKEFFFLLPKDIDPAFAEKLDMAVTNVMENQAAYGEDLKGRTYLKGHRTAEEAEEYLMEKRASIQKMIELAPDLDDITN